MGENRHSTDGFVELDGARLYYEMAGTGEPVVLLHGGMLDRRMWDDQFPFLAQHYQVIRYDVRRAGKSEASSEEAYVHYEDLRHLLDHLQIVRASLIGLSGGARIAIDMAIAYPERVNKLVLVSPGMSGHPFDDPWTHQHGRAFEVALRQGNVDQACEEFLTMWSIGPKRSAEQLDSRMRQQIASMVRQSLAQQILNLNMLELDPPAMGRLHELKAPTLVVLGDQDTSDIVTIAQRLQKQVAAAQLVIMPRVGHTLVMEKPEEFNRLVEQFLRADDL
ncbi:alpha/beta fold hydrolase [Dictyobacter aurantiacus]|uniref:Alpha/beta hydrolase n=1 Tax=Dictyobacter aurantiacus TaxID=1936993 RepID=A0A401ZNB4_9CHLR|nr:alpha/beta hydrolase [Dictyobacter aurantiacus]GCE08388.1 alpha/beta hydrolase [Dictyobacter aurantiacus]